MASAFGVVVMVVGVWWVVRVPPPPPEASIPFATTSVVSNPIASNTDASSTISSSTNITVYVSGEVVKPGVYVLLATARVIDALQAAGGATSTADLVVVNLAAPLVDAAQVFIPRIGSTPRVTLPRPHAGVNLPIAGGSGGAGYDISTFIGGSALYKAAGGGGGGSTGGGAGGSGVGGAGSTSTGNSAAINTASGGGGAGTATNGAGGNGGSGIVYVRWRV